VFLKLKKSYDGRLLHFKKGWFPRLKKLKFIELAQLGYHETGGEFAAKHPGVTPNSFGGYA
jgi:hypothetical protein